jgi:hypothetical protein
LKREFDIHIGETSLGDEQLGKKISRFMMHTCTMNRLTDYLV